MATGGVEEGRHILQVVLTIGVHLQGMAEAEPRSLAQAGHDRTALALVDRQLDQEDILAFGQLFQHRGAGRAAGIVHQHAGQTGRL